MNQRMTDLLEKGCDFKEFQAEAIKRLKAVDDFTGKDEILRPLIKKLVEAALEGEMEAHLADCKGEGLTNRRNGN